MLLDIDISKLPRDSKLAFVEIVTSLEEGLATAKDKDVKQQYYIDTIFAFVDAYNFDFSYDRSPPKNDNYFNEWFWGLRSQARQLAMHIQLQNRGKPSAELTAMVALTDDFRQEIHNQIQTIRKIVVVADLSDRKRDAILAKLNELAAEVDRSKTGFENALSIFLDLSEAVEKGHEKMSPALDRMERILKRLAGQREDDTPALPAPDDRKRLPAPEKSPEDKKGDDLDDEIPF